MQPTRPDAQKEPRREIADTASALRGMRLPHFIASRGNSIDYPGNTLPALRSALELGMGHIALDVQLTADYNPVLLRSPSLKHITNLDRNVFELKLEDVAQLRVNIPSRFGQRPFDVGIPTLSQVATLLTAYPTAIAFIDIQTESLQRFGYQTTIDAICTSIRKVIDRVILVATDLPFIEFSRRTQNLLTGWILPDYSRITALKCEAIAPNFLFCEYGYLPKDRSRLWKGPWHWVVNEVNTVPLAIGLAERGVDFIVTSEVRQLLRERRLHKQSV